MPNEPRSRRRTLTWPDDSLTVASDTANAEYNENVRAPGQPSWQEARIEAVPNPSVTSFDISALDLARAREEWSSNAGMIDTVAPSSNFDYNIIPFEFSSQKVNVMLEQRHRDELYLCVLSRRMTTKRKLIGLFLDNKGCVFIRLMQTNPINSQGITLVGSERGLFIREIKERG